MKYDWISEIAKIVIAVVLGLGLVLFILTSISSQPSHEEMFQRQIAIENQLRFLSCLLLIPPDERIPEAVASCQVQPEHLTPSTTLTDE